MARQIHHVIEKFSATSIVAQLVVGGVVSSGRAENSVVKTNVANDLQVFCNQKPQILVGTPGRLEELLQHSQVSVKELEIVVLDEADR